MPVLAVTAPFGFDAYDQDQFFALWAELGCRSCQMLREVGTDIDPPRAREMVERHGLSFNAIHGRFKNGIDLSNPDDHEVRARSVEAMIEDGDLVRALGGRVVIVHPAAGVPSEWRGTALPADLVARRWEAFARSLDALASAGEQQGVVYAIENLPRSCWIGHDAPDLARRVREIGSPALRMCFDTGHAHLEATPPALPCAGQFEACADVVAYVHVHDNAGDGDHHLIPGEGTIDWEALSAAIARHPDADLPAMLELFHTEDELRRVMETVDLASHLRRACGVGIR